MTLEQNLKTDSVHKILIDLRDFPPYKIGDSRNKKSRSIFNEYLRLLDKRLSEVKILYIINPTTFGAQDTSQTIKYDTTLCSIYKLNFAKMTSLQTVYLIGDDADDIVQMPTAFYKSPVKTIYYSHLTFSHRLKKDIKTNSKKIRIVEMSDKDWDLIARICEL